MNREEPSAPVPERDRQAEEDLWQRHKAERGVWTEPMLVNGIDGWIRMRLRSILRKRRGLEGRGRGIDHQRWPNRYFTKLGLFCLPDARESTIASLRNGANH